MKKIIILELIILLIMSLPYYAIADELKLDSEWDLDFDVCDIAKDNDNNYLLVGFDSHNAIIRKYDNNHNLIYAKNFPDRDTALSVTVDDNNNYYVIILDYNDHFIDPEHNVTKIEEGKNLLLHHNVVKFDANGNILFDLELDTGNNNSAFRGIEIHDNYLYVVGERDICKEHIGSDGDYEFYNFETKSYLLKIDLSGYIVSETILGEKTSVWEGMVVSDTNDFWGSGSRKRSF